MLEFTTDVLNKMSPCPLYDPGTEPCSEKKHPVTPTKCHLVIEHNTEKWSRAVQNMSTCSTPNQRELPVGRASLRVREVRSTRNLYMVNSCLCKISLCCRDPSDDILSTSGRELNSRDLLRG